MRAAIIEKARRIEWLTESVNGQRASITRTAARLKSSLMSAQP
jgi:hypothetical protein